MKHWELVSGFVIVTILLVMEEVKSQGGHMAVTPTSVTHLINREDAVVIDLRDPSAYRAGHIVNAKNFPLSEFDRSQEKLKVFETKHLILTDSLGAKTVRLAMRLKKAGFQHVFILKGGMEAWKTAGMPMIKK